VTDLDEALRAATVVAIGPGSAPATGRRGCGRRCCARAPRTVVDADALNLLAATRDAARGWIITPHPGEAAGC
jgi:NAD(P)H-hydrate epimerase